MFMRPAAESQVNRTGNPAHRKPLMATRMLLLVSFDEVLDGVSVLLRVAGC
jgi:hypothetical protein